MNHIVHINGSSKDVKNVLQTICEQILENEEYTLELNLVQHMDDYL